MSVASVTRSWSLNASEKTTGGDARTAGYSVILTDSAFGEQVALTAVDPNSGLAIPKFGEQYKPGDFLRVKAKRAEVVTPLMYTVIVEYDDQFSPAAEQGQDPLSRPAEINWQSVRSIEQFDVDANGQPITNTVGESFPVNHDVTDPAVNLRWNRAAINVGYMLSFAGSTNSNLFMGALPGQARVDSISAAYVEERVETGSGTPQLFQYWQISATIHFREGLPLVGEGENQSGGPARAWYKRVANRGTRELIGIDEDNDNKPIYRNITDDAGRTVREPVLLTREGRILPDDQDPVYLEFQMNKVRNFAGMGIPL